MSNYWLDRKDQGNRVVELEQENAALRQQIQEAENIAQQGYQEAWEIISDLRNRLEQYQAQGQVELEKKFAEAAELCQEEQNYVGKLHKELAEANQKVRSYEARLTRLSAVPVDADDLEVRLYEEYDKKLQEMKQYFVDKVDPYLECLLAEYNGDVPKLVKDHTGKDIVEKALEQ